MTNTKTPSNSSEYEHLVAVEEEVGECLECRNITAQICDLFNEPEFLCNSCAADIPRLRADQESHPYDCLCLIHR